MIKIEVRLKIVIGVLNTSVLLQSRESAPTKNLQLTVVKDELYDQDEL